MTVDSVLKDMLAAVPADFDTEVGSFFYDLLYPVAEQVYRLQKKLDTLTENAYMLTASGEYLERKTAEQNIYRKAAAAAQGILTFTGKRGATIRAGALASSDNLLFAAAESAVIPESGQIDIPAVCKTAGEAGNVFAGAVNRLPVSIPGITGVTNAEAFTGGVDAQSDQDLKLTYIDKVSKPHTSGNAADYKTWATQAHEADIVKSVKVIPLHNGPGTVKVIIAGDGGRPLTPEDVETVRSHIETERPVGALVTVETPLEQMVAVSVTLQYTSDNPDKAAILASIREAVNAYAETISVEKNYVSLARVGSAVLSVAGVEDYSGLTLDGGEENIEIPDGYIPVLEVTVNG